MAKLNARPPKRRGATTREYPIVDVSGIKMVEICGKQVPIVAWAIARQLAALDGKKIGERGLLALAVNAGMEHMKQSASTNNSVIDEIGAHLKTALADLDTLRRRSKP